MPQRADARAVILCGLGILRQIEAATTRRADHIAGRIVVDQLNRLMTVRTANLHDGPCEESESRQLRNVRDCPTIRRDARIAKGEHP